MPNFLKSDETVIEEFETIGDWTVSGGTAAVVSFPAKSDYALKLTGGAGTNCIATKTISRSFQSDPNLKFWVYIPVLADVASVQVVLSSDAAFATYFSKTVTSSYLHEGWNRVICRKTDFSATGAESWANTMVRLRVRVNCQAGATGIAVFDELGYGMDRAVVQVSFDDGWDSQYLYGFAYMRPLGLKGTCYVPGSYFGSADYMTEAQANEIYAAGWDICNHTNTHTNLTTYTSKDDMKTDIADGMARLSRMGFTRNDCHRHMAYPQGGYNTLALIAAREAGCLTARTIISTVQSHEVEEPMLVYRMVVVDTTSLADAQGYIDRAIGTGGMIQLNFHKIVAGAPAASTEWNEADFLALMQYLATKKAGNLCDVMTMSEWYRACSAARRET